MGTVKLGFEELDHRNLITPYLVAAGIVNVILFMKESTEANLLVMATD